MLNFIQIQQKRILIYLKSIVRNFHSLGGFLNFQYSVVKLCIVLILNLFTAQIFQINVNYSEKQSRKEAEGLNRFNA